MELTLTEQLRERQETEKKLQKLAKTMDYLERAKREEAAALIEAAYIKRQEEEKILHEREQQVCWILLFLDYHSCLCYFDIGFCISIVFFGALKTVELLTISRLLHLSLHH